MKIMILQLKRNRIWKLISTSCLHYIRNELHANTHKLIVTFFSFYTYSYILHLSIAYLNGDVRLHIDIKLVYCPFYSSAVIIIFTQFNGTHVENRNSIGKSASIIIMPMQSWLYFQLEWHSKIENILFSSDAKIMLYVILFTCLFHAWWCFWFFKIVYLSRR